MQSSKIAVIDNGIEEAFLRKPLEYKIFVTDEGQCVPDDMDMKQVGFRHGTTCAMIIEKYYPDCSLSSIRVLDPNGDGSLTKVAPALEWCLQHQIKVINLSLGTTNFKDKERLRNIISRYTAQGLLIIAATSNGGNISYPASFSNVIGVAAACNAYNSFADNGHLGIDVLAPVERELPMGEEMVALPGSNSYAAPYVTALAGRLSLALASTNVCVIKKALQRIAGEHGLHILYSYYEPDWIHIALDRTAGRKSSAEYYFAMAGDTGTEAVSEADTVITERLTGIEEAALRDKNLVCLGGQKTEPSSGSRFLWTPASRLRQILDSRQGEEETELAVPVILCEWEDGQDGIFLLSGLKQSFAEDGYYLYTAGFRAESVLYGLEYLPEEILEEEHAAAFIRFICRETCYKQSDAVLLGLYPGLSDKLKLRDMADMRIVFGHRKHGYKASLICEGSFMEDMLLEEADAEAIRIIYRKIKAVLTAEPEG